MIDVLWYGLLVAWYVRWINGVWTRGHSAWQHARVPCLLCGGGKEGREEVRLSRAASGQAGPCAAGG